MGQVLIVDDEASIAWALREALADDGHGVDLASSAEDGLRRAESSHPDAVVLDVRLPGMDGLTALSIFRERYGPLPIVIMTAFGDLETAVRAVEFGAFEYLVKPFDLDHAASVISRAIAAVGRAPLPLVAVAGLPNDGPDAARLIGSGPVMQQLFKAIALVSRNDVAVLITGESGTGKELVARAIHRHSARSEGPFLPICVPALSPSLVERELFGHLRGAFTGADADRPGLLERANGGTILLDEVGDVPLDLQVKLLRAIEYREIVPVGGTRPRPIDVRFLAATNRTLPRMITEGRFREDLFFRLSVFPIRVPSLKERPEDVGPLAEHFARLTQGAACGDAGPLLDPKTIKELQTRAWPGNVRELRNAIEYASIVARGESIRPENLPEKGSLPVVGDASSETELAKRIAGWAEEQMAKHVDVEDLYERLLGVIEPPLLRTVLAQCKDNRLAAAGRLGIHRATLRQKLRRYEI
jgi:DNA-binding NtrC family response regulator